jgi:hypothetical protein
LEFDAALTARWRQLAAAMGDTDFVERMLARRPRPPYGRFDSPQDVQPADATAMDRPASTSEYAEAIFRLNDVLLEKEAVNEAEVDALRSMHDALMRIVPDETKELLVKALTTKQDQTSKIQMHYSDFLAKVAANHETDLPPT